jgi:hypothetical protein
MGACRKKLFSAMSAEESGYKPAITPAIPRLLAGNGRA